MAVTTVGYIFTVACVDIDLHSMYVMCRLLFKKLNSKIMPSNMLNHHKSLLKCSVYILHVCRELYFSFKGWLSNETLIFVAISEILHKLGYIWTFTVFSGCQGAYHF